jgi:rod shape determining protein RodA
MQYSAGDGHLEPFATKQIIRFFGGVFVFFIASIVVQQCWFSASYLFYLLAFVLILAVELLGVMGMGAQRWLDLGFLQIQPSEIMRIALPLALSRYFHLLPENKIYKLVFVLPPVFLVIFPVVLVMRQPDLGTALLLISSSVVIFFCAGVRIWKFLALGATAGCFLPIFWSMLYDYQKKRILVFLSPGSDPLNAGYHILQSQIAIGSGGFWGKGFLKGPQTHLNFLPEKQTDFVFAMFGEEFGFLGVFIMMVLFLMLLFANFFIAYQSKSTFGRLAVAGLNANLFCYVFVNVGMVSGILPVVGIPLPFISYGGTALVTLLLSQGIIASCARHNARRKNVNLSFFSQ